MREPYTPTSRVITHRQHDVDVFDERDNGIATQLMLDALVHWLRGFSGAGHLRNGCAPASAYCKNVTGL